MKTADSYPLVTVIIPVYNAEKYLRRGLESLLAQTCGNWEAVCIDDGSTDDSLSILKEYAARDARFRVLTQENSGVSQARNRGIQETRGEWVTFLDADDWVSPELLEKVLPETRRSRVDIIMCETKIDYAPGIERVPLLEKALLLKGEGEILVTPGEITISAGSCCAKVYRMSFIREQELAFPAGMRQEDEVFYRCAMSVARAAYAMRYPGYHYFLNGASYMITVFNPSNSYLLYLRGAEIVHDFHKSHKVAEGWDDTLLNFLFHHMNLCQKTLSRGEMRMLRKCTQPFLVKSGFSEKYRGNYRLRFLSSLPWWVEVFSHRGWNIERYQFMGITFAKDYYKDFLFEKRVTPWTKLKSLFQH